MESLQGLIVNGLVPSSVSTIERRYKISTSAFAKVMQVRWTFCCFRGLSRILGASIFENAGKLQFYDFGYVCFCIPVSYFGGRHSKPVVLATGESYFISDVRFFESRKRKRRLRKRIFFSRK